MTIQFNTDKTISGEERQEAYFTSQIKEGLDRFSSHITRVEVHLKDENGKKDGFNDISCLLEARMEGRKPLAVNTKGNSTKEAVNSAIDKMTNAMNKIIGKLQEH
ncbi:MAG: HPF/RaiA family ribosome-associated protein [Crocinitomicaceae bacterium]